jgi:hypothetical protein
MTRDATYCVGDPNARPAADPAAPAKTAEAPADPAAAPAAIRVVPADVTTHAGGGVKLSVKFLDANGREVHAPADAKVEWSLPAPPGAAAGPPPLKAEVKADGPAATVVADKAPPAQQGVVLAKVGNLTARCRVRVVAQLPYKNDFEKVPEGAAPGGWVNATGKFVVKTLDGNKVLFKVNTNPAPPVSRANGYVTLPTATNYVIQCDVMGKEVRGTLPDMGLVNCRYTLILDGKKDPDTGKRALRIVSWEARPRVNHGTEFDWQPNTWYTLKMAVEQKEKTAVVRGKVWKKGDPEPAKWTVEFEDPSPNREGAAAVYAYISNVTEVEAGSDAYFDNLSVTPAGGK